ncbi:CO or xanthine dehydrogenase, FAD-binding subunit [Nonomuraea solani]|uniref:CO or xanthine dehydrogenase, FAD-binding subunit n=1 Tax=Nonomuraea solani TaxID=1144553 RepID=A0A1H6EW76_9ACTN|nr:FAD binding domain-containing protein [Nonomuraea solani]SEH02097.1 CO or xanthine dehydrogenase, FAD-binding subunit [Nonomuraea solani]
MVISTVHVPESTDAAIACLAGGGWIMGGGTVVMPLVNSGTAPVTELVSLRRAGLDTIEIRDGVARIGAAATLTAVGEHPRLAFLRPALRTIASPTIRNQATVGGNLFVAQPYGDLAVCLLALDATCEVAGPDGRRDAPVAGVLAAGVAAGEVVVAVRVALPEPGTWHYHKAMRRRLNSAAIVTVASVTHVDDDRVAATRIALGGVASRPVRAVSAERLLQGRPLTHDVLTEAGEAARDDIDPFDDAYTSAWYRARVLPVHLRRAFLP